MRDQDRFVVRHAVRCVHMVVVQMYTVRDDGGEAGCDCSDRCLQELTQEEIDAMFEPFELADDLDEDDDDAEIEAYIFMNEEEAPEEEAQFEAYKRAVEAMHGLPLTIRTIDVGADKPERDAPVAVHPHRPVALERPFEGMQLVAGLIQLGRRCGGI